MEFRPSAHPTGLQSGSVFFTIPTSTDVPFIPSSPTVIHRKPPTSSLGTPTHASHGTSEQNHTLSTHSSGLLCSGSYITFSETPRWTTSTGPWTSPMHPTPHPPSFPDPNRGYPATVSTLDGFVLSTGVSNSALVSPSSSGDSISSNVAMLTAIPTVVCVSLGFAIYFFWRRARRNRWQKSFKAQLARRAIETRGDKGDSTSSSILKGNEVVR